MEIPRVAVVPTHNRPVELARLLDAIAPQCDAVVVVDNASDPPVSLPRKHWGPGGPGVEHVGMVQHVIRDEEQPPNLSRLWNVGIDFAREIVGPLAGEPYDVGVFNDDADVPPGWWDTVSTALREHPTAAVAHTHTYGEPTRPAAFHDDRSPMHLHERMCPWAFVMRGELSLRSDEALRWWWFDTDFEVRARRAGGVLSVPGPQVANTGANSSTVGPLAEQAGRDRARYAEIHGSNPW